MSACHDWPAKLMSSEYPAYTWPYGARALMAERAKVQSVLTKSCHMNESKFFQVPLTFHEGFVRNDTERITLTDRVRRYYNFNWKRDNQVRAGLAGDAVRHYEGLIYSLIELQALTEELKPETLVLMSNCAGGHELQQAMLNARDSAYPGFHRQLDEVD